MKNSKLGSSEEESDELSILRERALESMRRNAELKKAAEEKAAEAKLRELREAVLKSRDAARKEKELESETDLQSIEEPKDVDDLVQRIDDAIKQFEGDFEKEITGVVVERDLSSIDVDAFIDEMNTLFT